MKKILSILILLLVIYSAFGVKNWKSYTNTTHIFEASEIDGKLYLATWGGISVYNIETNDYERVFTRSDGLSENDIRSISYNNVLNQLFAGIRKKGVDRMDGSDILTPIETPDKITKICCNDSLTFVANREGMSVYRIIENWPIPVFWDVFTTDNGLSSNIINDFIISSNGMLVLATNAGVDMVDVTEMDEPSAWIHYTVNNSDLPAARVLSVYERDGLIVLGTESGMVTFNFNDGLDNWQITEIDKSVFPVYIDKQQDVWYGFGEWSEDLLQVINTETISIKKTGTNPQQWNSEDFSGSSVMGFIEIENKMFAYFWGEGVQELNGNNWISRKQNTPAVSLVKRLILDHDGNLWTSNGYIAGIGNPPLPRGTRGVSKFDGSTWETFNFDNSGIISNNIFSLAVDNYNGVWMGTWWADGVNPNIYGWMEGISVYDQSDGSWFEIHDADSLRNSAISYMVFDDENRMWISSCGGDDGGINVFDSDVNYITDFELYDSYEQGGNSWMDPHVIFIGENALYFGGSATGLRIWENWNGSNYPTDGGENWKKPPFQDLVSGEITSIASLKRNGKEEIWVGSVNGLYQYAFSNGDQRNPAGYYWFKYSPHIKRSVYWRGTNGNTNWYYMENAFYFYIEGQERLYAGELTFPKALLIDPFGIIWIGTDSNGITMYDPVKDIYKTYNTKNSPIISDDVTALVYDKITGTLYIGTKDGISSVQVGIAAEYNTEKKMNSIIAFPNPFYPGKDGVVRIENINKLTMPFGKTKCNIYDLNANLIITLDKNNYEQFSWDGNNDFGEACASGIYFYVVTTTDGQSERGKIALIR